MNINMINSVKGLTTALRKDTWQTRFRPYIRGHPSGRPGGL